MTLIDAAWTAPIPNSGPTDGVFTIARLTTSAIIADLDYPLVVLRVGSQLAPAAPLGNGGVCEL